MGALIGDFSNERKLEQNFVRNSFKYKMEQNDIRKEIRENKRTGKKDLISEDDMMADIDKHMVNK